MLQGQTTLPESTSVETVESTIVETPTEKSVEAPVEKSSLRQTLEKAAAETPEQREIRERDERGRFTKKEEQKLEQQTEAKPRPQRPSSWKKEMWDHWEKLDPSVAEYLAQREQEFARGVSTYKNEWDRAKPLMDAMQPLIPTLQQFNMQPHEWLQSVGNTHRMLVQGTDEQKLAALMGVAQTYKIPLEKMFIRGNDGNIYFNPQVQQGAQQLNQPKQPDVKQTILEVLEEQKLNQLVESFLADTTKYPHAGQVIEPMIGLLHSRLAPDLEGAYKAALALPQFAHLQTPQVNESEQVQKEVQRAKANAVSPKSSTPVATEQQPKGLRETIANQVYARAARI